MLINIIYKHSVCIVCNFTYNSMNKSDLQIFVEQLLRPKVTLRMRKVRIVRKNLCGTVPWW